MAEHGDPTGRTDSQPYGSAPHGSAPHGSAPYGSAPYGPAPYGAAAQGPAPYWAPGPQGPPPYGPVPYGYAQPPYGQVVPTLYGYAVVSRPTNGMAIASMVLGILWLYWIGSVLALVFGYVARSQIKQRGEAGGGMAIAGIVLGWVGVAAAAVPLLVLGVAGV